ncbi:MAG: chemotaxis protein CheW [Acetivibrionales bacterium]|jgi:purine-binding chemotaxis protein CheW|nr:chemotaxis protein CheW [Clostridiales bacterium]HPZ05307.1 chemotaxis protein CheW [Clostridiales bacterium]HQD30373.1 chemotaxis protein CheW [Clostridiales bacterium]
MSEMNAVIFNLNDQLFGAEASQVFQIIRYQEPSKMPKMPRFIEGIINYRDTVLPVINLAKRFDLGDMDITKKTKILVTKLGEKYAGFIVSDVMEIMRFEEDEVEMAPSAVNVGTASYLRKIGKKGDRLYSIIDLENILNEAERKRLPASGQKA